MIDLFTSWANAVAGPLGLGSVSSFEVGPPLAVLLVGLTCGLVGSLVVGNRMAFFADAMAHTAFAGVTLAFLGVALLTAARSGREADEHLWVVPLVMAAVGAGVGAAIAFVQEKTGLTHDTVIGVFFALAIGFGAMLTPVLARRVSLRPDDYLFGSLVFVTDADLFTLVGLAVFTAGVVAWRYNALVFASFNPSLARSRGLAVRANNYLFILLLALVVNLSIKVVGALLINALLVVPAAAAANVAKNLRQMFWLTLGGSAGAGLVGYEVSRRFDLGPGGTIVVVCVGWFAATAVWAAARRAGWFPLAGRPAGPDNTGAGG